MYRCRYCGARLFYPAEAPGRRAIIDYSERVYRGRCWCQPSLTRMRAADHRSDEAAGRDQTASERSVPATI